MAIAAPNSRATHSTPTESTSLLSPEPLHTNFPIRNFEISYLNHDGSVATTQAAAPALPLFEMAFTAFTHGSVVQTNQGPIPVEDLVPGDLIQTVDGREEKLIWVGSTTYAQTELSRRSLLVRLNPDAFGVSSPSSYLTLGPAARVLKTPPRLRGVMEGAQLLTPVKQFEDGNMITSISPPTAIRLFHLCLERHSVINVGGLALESYHPGTTASKEVTQRLRDQFLGLFPHTKHMADFGPMAHDHAPDIQELIG